MISFHWNNARWLTKANMIVRLSISTQLSLKNCLVWYAIYFKGNPHNVSSIHIAIHIKVSIKSAYLGKSTIVITGNCVPSG